MSTLDDYLALVPSFNRRKPKFDATLRTLLAPLVDAKNLLASMPSYFDIDTAIGAQLDVVGEWVGQSRYIPIPILPPWFSFDDPIRGFDKGIWKGPWEYGDYITRLADDDYRKLLYAIVAMNEWDGMLDSAANMLDRYFIDSGTKALIHSNEDQSLVIGFSQKIPSILQLILISEYYIPLKPAGMKTYHRVISVNNTSLFGFDVDNEYVGGFDSASFGVSPEYIALHEIA